eukprot:6440497-Prymnesium_polylepis.1
MLELMPTTSATSLLITSAGHSPAVESGTPGACHLSGLSGWRSMWRHCVASPTAGFPVSTTSMVMPNAKPSVTS